MEKTDSSQLIGKVFTPDKIRQEGAGILSQTEETTPIFINLLIIGQINFIHPLKILDACILDFT